MNLPSQNPQTPDEFAKIARKALDALKMRRPIFHSEGDLRHELGWELTRLGLQNIRAEKPFQDKQVGKGRVDLAADGFTAELKYYADIQNKTVNNEKFKMNGFRESAPYDFWKDVMRVEQLVRNHNLLFGLVVCMTNNPRMWNGRGNSSPWLANFRMTDGNVFPCHLKIVKERLTDTKDEYWHKLQDIRLLREYALKWEDWAPFPSMEENGLFRYVVVEVRP